MAGMTQQPFSRPGAIDLSALGGPAPAEPGAPAQSGAYAVTVDSANFQEVLESSMNAAVVLVAYSPRSPESVQLADDFQALSNEFEGRFLLGRIDVDANPQITQAMQIQQVPMVFLVAQGRPMPLVDRAAPVDQLRQVLQQVFQQLAGGGFTGRHAPRSGAVTDAETGEETLDPRYQPAQDALERGDMEAAVAEYQKLVDANAADTEAVAGLAMAKVLQRTQGVDLNAARQQAAGNPDDVEAQIMVADLDLLGGHVDDAFNRLIDVVRRTADKERDRARQHLIDLFAAVGNEDQRVLRARRDLASALF